MNVDDLLQQAGYLRSLSNDFNDSGAFATSDDYRMAANAIENLLNEISSLWDDQGRLRLSQVERLETAFGIKRKSDLERT